MKPFEFQDGHFGLNRDKLISIEEAAAIANELLHEWLKAAPTILMDELCWSFEGDLAFKDRATKSARLVCIEPLTQPRKEKGES